MLKLYKGITPSKPNIEISFLLLGNFELFEMELFLVTENMYLC